MYLYKYNGKIYTIIYNQHYYLNYYFELYTILQKIYYESIWKTVSDFYIWIIAFFEQIINYQLKDVGCVIEGFPSNFKINLENIQKQLNRRRPGQSLLTTPRDQKDQVECVSGMENGRTLGSPLCFLVKNQNIIKKDYSAFVNVPRPGHADFTYLKKYGIKAQSGGGRSSARETIGRVIAGALAKQFLLSQGIYLASWVCRIKDEEIPSHLNSKFIAQKISNEEIEKLGEISQLKNGNILIPKRGAKQFIQFQEKQGEFHQQNQYSQKKIQQQNGRKIIANLRCPYYPSAIKMFKLIKQAQNNNDSLGGYIQGAIYNLPIGLGQPSFDKFPALLSHAMLSLPATKGFEYGSGFNCTKMYGSEHNDQFDSKLRLQTNNSGGSLGGITTGETFHYKVAFKPVSTIAKPQQTHDFDGKPITLQAKGRHDPCVLPRAPPIVDNMAAIVVMDSLLILNSQKF